MALTTSRQMLVHLGLSASATNDIYHRQGIDSIDEWEKFDKDNIFSLIHLVSKPGDGGNGEMVGFKAELNLQIAVFYIHHKIRTIRIVEYEDINVPVIRDLKKQRKIEAIKEPKTDALKIDLKDVSKT